MKKTLKKMAQGIIAGAALMGMVSSAGATEYNLNIYGASAQHKFWLNLAPDFLLDASGGNCASVAQDSFDKKHGIARGIDCLGNNDTIYIRYSSRASYDGVNAVNTGTPRDMVDEASCVTWAGPNANSCTAKRSIQPNLGASDVAWNEFTQSTSGYEDGNINFPNDPYASPSASVVFPDSIGATIETFNPIVVPFAFFANNSVCKFRCVRPEINGDVAGPIAPENWNAMGSHKAYPHGGWECDPTLTNEDGSNPQCVGYYKCINSLCNGGVYSGDACTTANDCPDVDVSATRCEATPLNKINHAMAGLIFSGKINNWEDFGPYFCQGPIVRCMRHAGSGTHATVADLLKPYKLAASSMPLPLSLGPTWHYTSSSDLMRCVVDFKGAIGYADADKLLDFKGIKDGCAEDADGNPGNHLDDQDGVAGAHIMQYNGVEPTRQKIVNCEYEFWAAQHVYYDTNDFTGTLETLRQSLEDFSSNAANLTEANLGNAADFWAAQSELKCSKAKVASKKYIITP